LQDTTKFTQIGIVGLKICHLATLMQCSEQSGPKWFFKMSAGIINAAVPTHQLPESATSEKFFASTEKKLQENFCPTKSLQEIRVI
jgi:hypothetical protein